MTVTVAVETWCLLVRLCQLKTTNKSRGALLAPEWELLTLILTRW